MRHHLILRLLFSLLFTTLVAIPVLASQKPRSTGGAEKSSRRPESSDTVRQLRRCEAQDRCNVLAKIVSSRTAAELEQNYAGACHAYPERALRSLRLYQLAPSPSREIALLDTMPRGIGDFAAMLWLTTDGGSEDIGDISYYYGTFYPDDELAADECTDWTISSTRRAFNEYYQTVARGVARHPRYMPRFFAVCEFFGHRDNPNDYGYNENKGLKNLFDGLLAPLYKRNPKTFRRYADRTRYGGAVLNQAMSDTPPSPY